MASINLTKGYPITSIIWRAAFCWSAESPPHSGAALTAQRPPTNLESRFPDSLYCHNVYFADMPYQIDGGKLDVWIRLVPDPRRPEVAPKDGAAREVLLTQAVACHSAVRLEVQEVGDRGHPFVPIAEIRFEAEISLDQEALHFLPIAGRGFSPHGFLTDLRTRVYPTSVRHRASSRPERVHRDAEGLLRRWWRFLWPARRVPRESQDGPRGLSP